MTELLTKDHINALSYVCHEQAAMSGWWTNQENGEKLKPNVPRLLMLCVSELSEAMEGDRKDLMDDHLPSRKMLEVELADCVIRIMDMAGAMNMDIGGAICEKLSYNAMRADHKPENRIKEGGKKY